MAIGNYTKVYKKHPFSPENYSILNGPCQFELPSNSSLSQVSNTQSLLINSVHDYSVSSMEDLLAAKKRSSRRKEANSRSIQSKAELNPADFVKNLKLVFTDLNEQKIVDILCSTESSGLKLLDKDTVTSSDKLSADSLFKIEFLNNQIFNDNLESKPLIHRIVELISVFFVQSLRSPEFPQSLSGPIINLWELFKIGIIPIDCLKAHLEGEQQYNDLLLGICEVSYSLSLEFKYELSICRKNQRSSSVECSRLELMEILLMQNEIEKFSKLEELANTLTKDLLTRYSYPLTAEINSQSLQKAIKILKLSKTVEYFENNLEEPIGGAFDEETIKTSASEMKLRLCKLVLFRKPADSETDTSGTKEATNSILKEAIYELINCHSELEISKFADFLNVFILGVKELDSVGSCSLICLFWNILNRKQHYLLSASTSTPLLASIQASFTKFLYFCFDFENLEFSRFILNWMSQEKCFGTLNGLVPLKIFRIHSQTSKNLIEFKFAYSIILSLFRFPNIFAGDFDLEDFDRHPIGVGTRDIPCPDISTQELDLISNLIHRIGVKNYDIMEDKSKVMINEPGFVGFVDCLKKQFDHLLKQNEYTNNSGVKNYSANNVKYGLIQLNRCQIKTFLNSSIENFANKKVLNISSSSYPVRQYELESFNYLLNSRSEIVHSELQGRKKSLEILKTIRKDLKTSLSLNATDPEVWKLLGFCYYDTAVHLMSSEAEILVKQSGKLKQCIKKAIFCLVESVKHENGHEKETWTKLTDLIDWAFHEPSLLSVDPKIMRFLSTIGSKGIKALLIEVIPRDRWILSLRFELFLRRSGYKFEPAKQLNLLKEASLAACRAYSENVYESTALYMSLVKFYSRLSKFRMKGIINESDVITWLNCLHGFLPNCLAIEAKASASGDISLLNHLESLNALDRKKIFHSHLAAIAWHSTKVLGDPRSALNSLQIIFPFLKQQQQKKSNSTSLIQIYQCEHERPARFLIAGKRYLLQLLSFLNDNVDSLEIGSLSEILTQFLKKLHYIRKTILGFPEILTKATFLYLNCPEPDESIVKELVGSLESVCNGEIPQEIKEKLLEINAENKI